MTRVCLSQKMMTHHCPSPWVINERHVLTLGPSMHMIHERRMMTHPQMMNGRHDAGPPPPENDDSSLPPLHG